MKNIITLLAIMLLTLTQAQSDSYESRVAAMEAKKEAKRKRIEEYVAINEKTYKVGDTITVLGKLGLYDAVYNGTGANVKKFRYKRPGDVGNFRIVIYHLKRGLIASPTKTRLYCKGLDKKGRYTLYIDRAIQNEEIEVY